jgi:chromosome segregation ATPase
MATNKGPQGTQRNTQDEAAEIRRLEGETARAEKKADDAEKELDIHKEKMQDMQTALRTSADQLAGVAAALTRVTRDYKEAKERRIGLEKQQASVIKQTSQKEQVSSRRNSEVTPPEQPPQRRLSKGGIQRRPSIAGKGQDQLENADIEERGTRVIEDMQKECSAAYNLTSSKLFRKSSEPNEKTKKEKCGC